MNRYRWLGLTFAALSLGCGADNATEPHLPTAQALSTQVPDVRQYEYRLTEHASSDVVFTGTLTIRYASADSVAGRVDVAGLDTSLALGQWSGDAYRVDAKQIVNRRIVEHRIVQSGSGMTCSARVILYRFQGGATRSRPATCTLR